MNKLLLLILGIFILPILLYQLRRWFMWFIHVRLWVRRRQRPAPGRVVMSWDGEKEQWEERWK